MKKISAKSTHFVMVCVCCRFIFTSY